MIWRKNIRTIQSALVSTDRIYEILDETDLEDPEAGTHGGPCTERRI